MGRPSPMAAAIGASSRCACAAPGSTRRLAQRATLDRRRRGRHREQDRGRENRPMPHRSSTPCSSRAATSKSVVAPACIGPEGHDVPRRPADELDRLVPEGDHRAVPRVDRHDGRLCEDEAAPLGRHARHGRADVDREGGRHGHDGRGDAQSPPLVATLSQVFRRLRYHFEMRGAGRSGSAPPPTERTWVHPSELPGSFDHAALPPARVAGSRRFKASSPRARRSSS